MRKIKWGVIGTGFISDCCTVPGMKMAENCELYAVASRSLEKAEAFKEKHGFEKAYGSYEELLADPQLEAVYIALPNTMHKEWSIKAAEAKKHILCEKPLAPTARECEEMIAAANANGVVLMEAFAYLHSPVVSAVKAEVDSGILGDILYMESCFLTSDYDISNIRMRRETFGGCTYDLGCYNTSQILWMLGQEPEKVQAVADFSDEHIDVFTTALLSFKNGVRAQMNCGMTLATDADKRVDRFQIHGTKGFLKSEIRFNMEGEGTYMVCAGDKCETKTVSMPQNYKLEVEQLGRCITDGEKPHVSNEFTMMNARTLDKILSAIGY